MIGRQGLSRAERRFPSGLTSQKGIAIWAAIVALALSGATAPGAATDAPYSAPATDTKALRGVDFASAQLVDPGLTALYRACDASHEHGGCADDPAHNTVILRFPDGTVLFDAKMAIDADGSALSKRAEHPNQPETAFRYPDPTGVGVGPSLDSERVPYAVMPMGDFRRETGVSVGDLAAVVHDGQVRFAIVGDVGPRTHVGEASMKLHAALGHDTCTARDADGNCSAFTDVSIDPPVLYFFFPDTRKLLYDGLNAGNINARIEAIGQQVWNGFLARQRQEGAKDVGRLPERAVAR